MLHQFFLGPGIVNTMGSWDNAFEAQRLIDSGLPERIASGIDLLKRESNAGSAYSKYLLGRVHEFGIGIQKDLNRARLYYLDAMNGEDVIEQDYLALQFSTDTHESPLADLQPLWFQKNLNLGSKDAMYYLGRCYQKAIGVALDADRAVHFLKMGFDNGISQAAAALAKLYEELGGQEADRLAALEFAASHGHSDCQYQLAVLYREGKCVKPDQDLSMTWLAKAANEGLHAHALLDLASIELDDNSLSYAPNQAITRLATLLRRDQQYRVDNDIMADACWRLGRCWLHSIGIAKNHEYAGMAFHVAATLGHDEATKEFWSLHGSGLIQQNVDRMSASQFDDAVACLVEQLKGCEANHTQTSD